MKPAARDRYLDLLGAEARPPSSAALGALVAAHLARVPFENVSKLVRAARGLPPGLPAVDEFLDAAARDGAGGTCYLLASSFNGLLRALGYDARLAGAAMGAPDQHLVNVVRLDGRPYLVDVGYGAPLRAPLALDRDAPQRVASGGETYVLHPAAPASGFSRLDHVRGGAVVHGYEVDPRPRRLQEFAGVVAASFRPEAAFLGQLRAVRHGPERSVSLKDFSAGITEDGRTRALVLAGRTELLDFAAAELGLRPALVAAACDALAARGRPEFSAG